MIKIYFCNAENFKGSYQKLLPLIPEERKKKAERLLREEDKMASALSGAMLQKVLNLRENQEILYAENGKPYIEGELFFSISHSKNWVLLALSEEEVGADIEIPKEVREKVMERCFLEEEKAFSKISPENFARVWTLKEAATKLSGKGISLPFKSFSVLPADEMHRIDGKEVFFFSGEIVGTPFAIASQSKIEEVKIYEITPEDFGLI